MPTLPAETQARNLLGAGYAMAVTNATALAPQQYPARIEQATTGIRLLAGLVFLGVIWGETINHLRNEWSQNPQYHYAYSVPFLALYLIWKRWLERPPAEPGNGIAIPLVIAGALLILPLRFVSEANPDWRLLSWTMSLVAIAVTLAFVYYIGGRPWLRHFIFPILFFLVAVPWPVQFEQSVIQNLMWAVTAINVFFLTVVGVPALQHGNVIEVRSGMLGIEEACSGVRSLQATLMVSLFLGEFYSFSVRRRLILVIAGAILAFFCNLVRTGFLVWLGAQEGSNAIHAWHDSAGLTILLVCLFGLWGLSLVMLRGSAQPAAMADTSRQPRRLPMALLCGLTSAVLLGELSVQAWYRMHQTDIISRWGAEWPTGENAYRTVPIAPATQEILRYDDGGGANWKSADMHPWAMYFFRWLPGRTAALFVKVHRPDICLPASGLTLTRDDGIRLVDINGVKLPLRSYRFDDHGVPLHVIYCYWDARSSFETVSAAVEEDWTARGRLRAALRGRREVGAQMLELVVWGYEEDAEANLALQHQLARIVQGG